jgi:hypothetical protein
MLGLARCATATTIRPRRLLWHDLHETVVELARLQAEGILETRESLSELRRRIEGLEALVGPE